MDRVSFKVRRIYDMEEDKNKKVTFTIDFDSDAVRDEFKSFLIDNKLLSADHEKWINTYFSRHFFIVEVNQLVSFFNYLSKLFTKYSFIISETGYIPIQLSYTKEILYNMLDNKLYNSIQDIESEKPLDSLADCDLNEVLDYVNGLIAIFKLFV